MDVSGISRCFVVIIHPSLFRLAFFMFLHFFYFVFWCPIYSFHALKHQVGEKYEQDRSRLKKNIAKNKETHFI